MAAVVGASFWIGREGVILLFALVVLGLLALLAAWGLTRKGAPGEELGFAVAGEALVILEHFDAILDDDVHVDLLAACLQPHHLGQRGQHHHHRGQQHWRLARAHLATGHHEAEMLGGEGGGPVLVALGVLEGAEEQQDGQEVEQQFQRRGSVMTA